MSDAWKPRFYTWRDGRPEGGPMPGAHPAHKSPRVGYRGYLPHFDLPGRVQSLGFRLGDAVPAEVLEKWRAELGFREAFLPADDPRQAELRRRIAVYEDAGHGECLLREPESAQIVRDSLEHFDGERYLLLAWCVMPNHVHALIETREGHAVQDVVGRWKSFTARAIHAKLGRTGAMWMPDYFDRYIRDATHLADAVAYIEGNPVKAGLCGVAEAWPFSSAFPRDRGLTSPRHPSMPKN